MEYGSTQDRQHRCTVESENFFEKHILQTDCVSKMKNSVKK